MLGVPFSGERMRSLCGGLFIAAPLYLAGCAPVIETVSQGESVSSDFDGALLSYAFARGELPALATYTNDKGASLIITMSPLNALADFQHKHTLLYRHGGLSLDNVDIQLDGAMLKKVSSTSTDQTLAAIQNANALLTQVIATGATSKGSTKTAMILPAPPPGAPPSVSTQCPDNIKVARTRDLTNEIQLQPVVQQASSACSIDLEIKVDDSITTFGIEGYPKGGADVPTEKICDQAVCFRLTGGYKVKVIATLVDAKNKPIKQPDGTVFSVETDLDVLAPQRNTIGFVRFNRRAFVANTTTITFTNGMVSEFSATDPSEIAGFFSLPTAVLQAAAVIK